MSHPETTADDDPYHRPINDGVYHREGAVRYLVKADAVRLQMRVRDSDDRLVWIDVPTVNASE